MNKKSFTLKSSKPCFFKHKWEELGYINGLIYSECKSCGSKKITSFNYEAMNELFSPLKTLNAKNKRMRYKS